MHIISLCYEEGDRGDQIEIIRGLVFEMHDYKTKKKDEVDFA